MNVREELKAFVDNELTASEKLEVERALNSSPELREELEWLQQAKTELASWKGTPPPSGKEAVMAKVAGKRAIRPAWWRSRSLVLAGSACLILVALAAIGTLNRTGGSFEVVTMRSTERGQSAMSTEEGMDFDGAESSTMQPRANSEHESAGGGIEAKMPARDRVEFGKSESLKGAPEDQQNSAARSSPEVPSVGIPFDGRKIIFNGNMEVEVKDVSSASDRVTVIARKFQGFVQSSNVVVNKESPSSAQMSIRVPALHFDAAITELKGLGKVLSANNSGQDVTAQIVDLDARIKTMKAQEEQYRQVLRRTTRIGEILEVRSKLDDIRAEIESLQSQSSTFKNMARLSTIDLTLTEEEKPDAIKDPKPDDWGTDAWNSSVNVLNGFGRAVGRGVITLFVTIPIWIVPAILVGYIVKKLRT